MTGPHDRRFSRQDVTGFQFRLQPNVLARGREHAASQSDDVPQAIDRLDEVPGHLCESGEEQIPDGMAVERACIGEPVLQQFPER